MCFAESDAQLASLTLISVSVLHETLVLEATRENIDVLRMMERRLREILKGIIYLTNRFHFAVVCSVIVAQMTSSEDCVKHETLCNNKLYTLYVLGNFNYIILSAEDRLWDKCRCSHELNKIE